MKLNVLFSTALLTLAGLAWPVTSANAALAYSAGDLFLGFRGTGDASDYLVNIGNVSQFASLSPGGTVTVNTGGSISDDLATAFTASWSARTDVFWSISGTTYDGTTDLVPTLYATRARSNASVQSTPWVGRSNSAQVGSVSQLQALAGKYVQDGTAAGTSVATFQTASASNSYANLTAPASDFSIGGSIEGKPVSVLDFYRIDPVFSQPATYLGSFTLDGNGVATFTAAAVPEPSAWGLLGAALLSLIIIRRRLNASKLQS